MIQVSLVNQSTAYNDSDLSVLANALLLQVSRDFYPAWGVEAEMFYTPSGQHPTATHWALALLDDADQAGALGYHDVTPTGQPLGKIFVKTTLAAGQKVEVTASHELLEMLADPDVNLAGQNGQKFWAYEVGDPVENDEYQIVIPDGWTGAGASVAVSNFVLPSWWEASAPAPYDFLKRLAAPFTLTPGGYAQFIDLSNASAGWQQVAGKLANPRLESRFILRRWMPSGNIKIVSSYEPGAGAIAVWK